MTKYISLQETPERCHVVDLDGLILKLNIALQEQTQSLNED